ncbi:MAG: ribonuclease D [Anaerolineaceae bacterium]|nr:MAG: ribonuclease D [Anaerolineaceae bacterium]
MLEKLPPPVWVDTSPALESLVNDLSHQPRIAVDTESNSLHAYREQVCLIQFSTPENDYLVDPFALADLNAFAPIFANPRIEKIFHAAEYDLICLHRDFGFAFASIFDTMQAERILGYEKVGLDSALEKYFNVKVNKRFQKADWGARPLTRDLLEYARFDTHYLIPLRDLLQTELKAKGRWSLAREDFLRACRVNGEADVSAEPWERYASRRDLNLRELTILRELTNVREEIAARLDRPPFKVVTDDKLFAIARAVPKTKKELAHLGLSEKQWGRWGVEILSAVGRGVEAPLVKRKPAQRTEDAVLRRLDALKEWRKKVAAQMGVESDIVLPRPFLFSLAERGAGEMRSILASSPTRLEQYGEQILKVLGG